MGFFNRKGGENAEKREGEEESRKGEKKSERL